MVVWITGVGVLLALLYAPLLVWLTRASVETSQLSAGAVLVLFAVVICLRDTLETLQLDPKINNQGLVLLALGFACLWLAGRLRFPALPLVVLSFCLSFAAIISFLFGKLGVRQFLPALGAFLVFGLLVGLFPTLDWPLRGLAAKHAGSLLAWFGVPVQLGLAQGRPPELLLNVNGRTFIVATECNGFGLLTSSLLLATILAFQFRLSWERKIGLFAIAIPVAIVCNFLRIVSICLVAPRTQLPYGFIHEAIGLVFYLLGLGLVWHAATQSTPRKSSQSV
jgi:exosortase